MTTHDATSASSPNSPMAGGIWGAWRRVPLYQRILLAAVLGLVVGLLAGDRAGWLDIPGKLVLRLLGALAPPLILVAVVQALLGASIQGRVGFKLIRLLLTNTLVAIGIGLLVANVMQPGRARLEDREIPPAREVADPWHQILESVPKSVLGPLGDNGQVIGVVFLAVAFGLALRRVEHDSLDSAKGLIDLAMRALVVVLHWIIEIVPLAVFGVVASIIGVKGFGDFIRLGWFVAAVLVALALQACYYLVRVRLGSWVRPWRLVHGARDALVMAFSTASSTATMPVTYERLKNNVGVREESASLGALVGANFNNDGTALYEAMAVLFVAQTLDMSLTLPQQLMIVLTSVIASVGAAGIPEAGLVTMTLVFTAAGVPKDFIPVLLAVDWFLDRCRTTINVMGDLNVSCLLDGKERPPPVALAEEPA